MSRAGFSSEAELRKAGLAFADNRAIDLSALTGAELNNLKLGRINDKELRESMEIAVQNANESWNKMLSNYSTTVVRELNEFDKVVSGKGYEVTREQMDLYA